MGGRGRSEATAPTLVVIGMTDICVYSVENCPNCERLKSTLKELGIAFEEKDLETKEAIIELRYLACFPQEAPVLRSGGTAYESPAIFERDGTVNKHLIHAISGKV